MVCYDFQTYLRTHFALVQAVEYQSGRTEPKCPKRKAIKELDLNNADLV